MEIVLRGVPSQLSDAESLRAFMRSCPWCGAISNPTPDEHGHVYCLNCGFCINVERSVQVDPARLKANPKVRL